MTTRLNPYLSFRDNARQAMDFYESVFGGELTRATFAEFHASEDPAEQDKVMHSMLATDNGLTLMGADTPNSMDFTPAATAPSRSAATTGPSCAATGSRCRRPAPIDPCRSTLESLGQQSAARVRCVQGEPWSMRHHLAAW